MFKGLKRRLTLINTAILLVFLLLMAAAVYAFMDRWLSRDMDRRLAEAAVRVESLTQLPPDRPVRSEDKEGPEIRGDNPYREPLRLIWVLRGQDLEVTAISPDSGQAAIITLAQAEKAQAANGPQAATVTLDGEKFRLLSLPYERQDARGVVQVLQSEAMERRFMANLMTLFLALGLASILPAAAIGWYLAGRALIPIRKSWQQQQDFVSDASHELRTPLAVVQTNLEVALGNARGGLGENRVWLGNALTETKRMGKLINDLLLLAEADAQQVYLDPQLFDLSGTARQTADQLRPLFDAAGLQFSQHIPHDLLLEGDEARIRQLLVILLDNARKYTPPGGQVTLELAARPGKILEISVRDNGPGIAPEDQENIFKRFYRVDKARSRAEGSSGLGLSIADWIVRAHQGRIRVESQPGQGSRFIVQLPAAE